MATVNARAEEYRESDAFGDTPMDVLRAHAYLDLINGVSAFERIAIAEQQDETPDAAPAWAAADARGAHEPSPRPTMPVRARTLGRRGRLPVFRVRLQLRAP